MKKRLTLTLTIVLMITALAVTGCTPSETATTTGSSTTQESGQTGSTSPYEGQTIEVAYVSWACATANTYLVRNILMNEFGVDVNIRQMDAGLMWQAVETGDIDFQVTAWLPYTHADYYAAVKDNIVDLGPIYEDAKIGLVVPSYVTIDSIEEINEHASRFDGRIVGIDAGAGIMGAAAEAIDSYGMTEMDLLTSSDSAMTAELKTAYEAEEWVVVTGWTPHWKFAEFDLKFLDDPEGSFGSAETINAVTRAGFPDEYPEIASFLENYFLSSAELGELIGMMQEYDDNDEAAKAWIDENQSKINAWLS